MSMLDKLEKLGELRKNGVIDETEFQREKARILAAGDGPPTPPPRRSHVPDGPMPESNMVWAILTTLLCFLPFGIVAIVKASQVAGFWYAGQEDEARRAAASAQTWSIASAVVGGVITLIVVVIAASTH